MGTVRISISREARKIREVGKMEIERIKKEENPEFISPLSYFRTLEDIENKGIENESYLKVLKIFPNTTNDFDIFCSSVPEEYRDRKERLIERKYEKYSPFGVSGKKVYSPFFSYSKELDGVILDLFSQRVGAVKIGEEEWEDFKIMNMVANLQPGGINEARINQTLPLYILERIEEGEDFKEEFDRIFGRKIKEAFSEIVCSYPSNRIYLSNGQVREYIPSLSEWLEEIKGMVNKLENLKERYSKRLRKYGENIEEYCKDFFDLIIGEFKNNLKKIGNRRSKVILI